MDEADRIAFLPAYQLVQKIYTRELSCSTVLEAFLSRIVKQNDRHNALVTLNKEPARRRAAEADKALRNGEAWGPLHGVPISIKDQFATKGIRTTASLPKLAQQVPEFNATVVERLLNAGAIIIGKTNLPPMANDHQTRSPIFGVTNNPWNTEYTPGGSTGGGAAAVAAGMSALEIGSDLGGSLRLPAHFCGIYGLKPTENLVPGTGAYPKWPGRESAWPRRLFSYGPLARSVEDLELCLPIIAGPDSHDVQVPYIPLVKSAPKEFKEISLVWSDHVNSIEIDAEMKNIMETFVRKIAAAGCKIQPANPEMDFEQARAVYGKMVDLEIGIHMKPLPRFLLKLKGQGYREKMGFKYLVYPITYKKYLQVSAQRDMFISVLEKFLISRDGWICPVAPMPAYKHHEPRCYQGFNAVYDQPLRINERKMNYWEANSCFTTLFNLTGHPVVAMPIGFTKKGLPIGIQLVGRRWHDMNLLGIAKKIAALTQGYVSPPDGNS